MAQTGGKCSALIFVWIPSIFLWNRDVTENKCVSLELQIRGYSFCYEVRGGNAPALLPGDTRPDGPGAAL